MIVYQKIKGYKYRLVEQDSIWRSWLHKMPYDSGYLRLDIDGTLVAKKKDTRGTAQVGQQSIQKTA